MRTAVRRPILQRCFVLPLNTEPAQAWRCIAYNISATGIGVTLPRQLPVRGVLTVHAWNLPRARPLQVRIAQIKQVGLLWFAGCELVKRLTDAELQIWCSGPSDWPEKEKR